MVDLRGEPVSRILSTPDRDPGLDDHSSANRVATAVKLPTRASRALASLRRYPGPRSRTCPARGPYLALLRVGLAVPSLSPSPRWALTPPFHRYPASGAVSSLWRFPWGCPRRALPGTLANESPDFPRPLPGPRPSSPPRGGQLGPALRSVNCKAAQTRCKGEVRLAQRSPGPWPEPQPERREQGFRCRLRIAEGVQVGQKARHVR